MKRIIVAFFVATIGTSGCATVQSIIKSTFPYTATLTIPASSKADTTLSVTSTASSFDKIFGNQGTAYIKEVRIASAKIIAVNPNTQSMGAFKSVKLFISSGESSEVMIASRNDVSEHIGSDLVLDIDNSRFLDDYIKGSSLHIRMEYVLRNRLSADVSLRTSLSFSSSPNRKN